MKIPKKWKILSKNGFCKLSARRGRPSVFIVDTGIHESIYIILVGTTFQKIIFNLSNEILELGPLWFLASFLIYTFSNSAQKRNVRIFWCDLNTFGDALNQFKRWITNRYVLFLKSINKKVTLVFSVEGKEIFSEGKEGVSNRSRLETFSTKINRTTNINIKLSRWKCNVCMIDGSWKLSTMNLLWWERSKTDENL